MRRIACVTAIFVTACASAPDRQIVTLSQNYMPGHSQSVHLTDEAQKACNNRQMRRRALDNNPNNDLIPVTVISTVGEGTRMMTDLEVDCREVLGMKLLTVHQDRTPQPGTIYEPPQLISEPVARSTEREWATPVEIIPYERTYEQGPATIARTSVGLHSVEPGETLIGIAQTYCVEVEKLIRLNELQDPSHIRIGDRLTIPGNRCVS